MLRATLAAKQTGATIDSLHRHKSISNHSKHRLQPTGSVEASELLAALDLLEDISGNVRRSSFERLLVERQRDVHSRPSHKEHGTGQSSARGCLVGATRRLPIWAAITLAVFALRPGQQPPQPHHPREPEPSLPHDDLAAFGSVPLPIDPPIDPSSSYLFPTLTQLYLPSALGRRLQTGGGGSAGGSTCTSPCILPAACPASPTSPASPASPTSPTSAAAPASPASPAANETAVAAGNATAAVNGTATGNATDTADSEDGAADDETAADDAAAADAALGADPSTLLLLLAALLLGVPFLIAVGMTYFFCIKRP